MMKKFRSFNTKFGYKVWILTQQQGQIYTTKWQRDIYTMVERDSTRWEGERERESRNRKIQSHRLGCRASSTAALYRQRNGQTNQSPFPHPPPRDATAHAHTREREKKIDLLVQLSRRWMSGGGLVAAASSSRGLQTTPGMAGIGRGRSRRRGEAGEGWMERNAAAGSTSPAAVDHRGSVIFSPPPISQPSFSSSLF